MQTQLQNRTPHPLTTQQWLLIQLCYLHSGTGVVQGAGELPLPVALGGIQTWLFLRQL